MARSYLNQIRLAGQLKQDLREIMQCVAARFNVTGAIEKRPVPHITLFGPYQTDHGMEAKERTQAVLGQYDVVPYRIEGFGHFRNEVIYAKVVPSPQLRSLRQELAGELRPIAYDYQSHDTDDYYDFHITIAFNDIERQFDEIWDFVTQKFDLHREKYAKRVTALDGRKMMWEWDLPRGKELRKNEATSQESWDRTEAALAEFCQPDDHQFEDPKPDQTGWLRDKLDRVF